MFDKTHSSAVDQIGSQLRQAEAEVKKVTFLGQGAVL
jgi:hypothetical protein